MGICKQHLSFPGSSRDMAAKLIGRLLSRPDTGAALLDFLKWCDSAACADERAATFLIPGEPETLPVLASFKGVALQLLDWDLFRGPERHWYVLTHYVQRTHAEEMKRLVMSEADGFYNAGILQSLCEIVGCCGQSLILSNLPQLWSKALQLHKAGNRSTSAR